MTLIAMVSAKGSPGVSTASLACALTWPGPTMLAECDPAGGDLLAGYLSRYEIPANRGVLQLSRSALRGTAAQDLVGQLIDLDSPRQQRMALPGLTDPAQGASLAPAWARLGEFFAGLSQTVIADCGRLTTPHPPYPLLAKADLVLLVLRARSLRTVSPAVSAIAALRRELLAAGHENNLGLLLVGSGISARDIARHLVVPVVAALAWDSATAAALCGEGRGRRRGPLMRSAAAAHRGVQEALAARQEALTVMGRQETQPLPVPVPR
jgi:hypothetical protein